MKSAHFSILCLVGCHTATAQAPVDASVPADFAHSSTADLTATPVDGSGSPTDSGGGGGDGGGNYRYSQITTHTAAGHDLLYFSGFVYAVDYGTDIVYAIDPTTRGLATSIAVSKSPHHLFSDDHNLYVLNVMAFDLQTDYFLSVVDPSTNTVTHSIKPKTFMQGSDPNNYPTSQGPMGGCALNGSLYVDFPTNAIPDVLPIVVGSWSTSPLWAAGSGPADITAADGKLFIIQGRVIFDPDDDAIMVTQPDGTQLQMLETGGALQDIITANGKVWASRAGQNGMPHELLVIDPATYDIQHVTVGAGAFQMASMNGKVYVACTDDNSINVVDASSLTVVAQIPLGGYEPAITKPRGVAVSPAGDVYVESNGQIGVLVEQ